MFCAVIAAKRFVGSAMDNVCPVGFWLESMTGTSTLWSDERISPFAYFFSFLNVAVAASALSMLLKSCFGRLIGSDGCMVGMFCEVIMSELCCRQVAFF